MALHATPSRRPAEALSEHPEVRPWLGIRFVCAGAYLRVYRHADGSRYLARCPRCSKTITFRVEPGGTNQRFFDVSC